MLMEALDTFIGLITVFLILSLIVSALGEGISNWRNFKGRVFKRSIETWLGEPGAKEFFEHEAVLRLSKPGKPGKNGGPEKARRLPSYVPDSVITEVVIDLCVNSPKDKASERKPISPNTIDRALSALRPGYPDMLKELWHRAQCDVETFKKSIADWFNRTGDRSVGWFKRQLGYLLFGIGLVAAIGLNADTLYMFKALSNDASLRESFVERASEIVADAREGGVDCTDDACQALVARFVDNPATATDPAEIGQLAGLCGQSQDQFEAATCSRQLAGELDAQKRACGALGVEGDCTFSALIGVAVPEVTPLLGFDLFLDEIDKRPAEIGWTFFVLLKLLGWTLTAAAISLGAPFWFDLLQKVVQIRSSLKPAAAGQAAEAETTPSAPATAQAPRARALIRSAASDPEALEKLSRFEAVKFGFSPVNLFWSARFSKLAYVTQNDLIKAELEDWEAEGGLLDRKDTQCVVACTPKAAFISFRGTEQNFEDWLSDVRVGLEAPKWDAGAAYRVHHGFNEALDVIWDDVEKKLGDLDVYKRRLPIWLSGHSLGGALAALGALRLAYRLKDKGDENVIAALHTFGQPRVGNRACASALDGALPSRYFRSVNNRDIVPRVPLPKTPDVESKIRDKNSPLKILDYAHAGRVIYFTEAGKAMMDPPLWYRGLDTMAVGATQAEITDALKQAVGDHDMSGYVRLHRAMIYVPAAGGEEAA